MHHKFRESHFHKEVLCLLKLCIPKCFVWSYAQNHTVLQCPHYKVTVGTLCYKQLGLDLGVVLVVLLEVHLTINNMQTEVAVI